MRSKEAQEIWDIISEMAKRSNEMTKRYDEMTKKSDERREKNDLYLTGKFDRIAEKFDTLTGKIEKVNKLVGNIGNNNGGMAEDFFYNGLCESMQIEDMTFDFIEKHVLRRNRGVEDKFDIILSNSASIVIVEVKYRVRPDDVRKIHDKKIPNYRKLFPLSKDSKIYGAIAGLSILSGSRSLAEEFGFFILTQSGKGIKITSDALKVY